MKLALISVAVVVSGAAAVITADHAINGTINDMNEPTAQTAPKPLTNEVQADDSLQVQTVTTPEGVIQAAPTQAPADDVTAPVATDNAVTEITPETVVATPTQHSFANPTPTVTNPSTITFGN